jgi:hypothetical protein
MDDLYNGKIFGIRIFFWDRFSGGNNRVTLFERKSDKEEEELSSEAKREAYLFYHNLVNPQHIWFHVDTECYKNWETEDVVRMWTWFPLCSFLEKFNV